MRNKSSASISNYTTRATVQDGTIFICVRCINCLQFYKPCKGVVNQKDRFVFIKCIDKPKGSKAINMYCKKIKGKDVLMR